MAAGLVRRQLALTAINAAREIGCEAINLPPMTGQVHS